MYTPHIVTLVMASEGDNGLEYNSVVLYGVFLDLNKRSNVNKSGLADADSATLYIPFSINTAGKEYLPPKEYAAQTNKSAYWTIFDGGDASGADCYFIKGAVNAPGSYAQARETYDYVYRVTSVDLRDFGRASMRHWMVGGR